VVVGNRWRSFGPCRRRFRIGLVRSWCHCCRWRIGILGLAVVVAVVAVAVLAVAAVVAGVGVVGFASRREIGSGRWMAS